MEINFVELFKLVGAGLGYILTVLKIRTFLQKRVLLKIDCKIPENISYNQPITIQIRNEGLRPTTISKVKILGENREKPLFNFREKNASGEEYKFKRKRIGKNDSLEFQIYPSDKIKKKEFNKIEINHSKGEEKYPINLSQ